MIVVSHGIFASHKVREVVIDSFHFATCDTRLLQSLYRGESTAAPRATQVAAPTAPSLCKASNAQLNIGSAAIYSAVTALCLAAISVPMTTLAHA